MLPRQFWYSIWERSRILVPLVSKVSQLLQGHVWVQLPRIERSQRLGFGASIVTPHEDAVRVLCQRQHHDACLSGFFIKGGLCSCQLGQDQLVRRLFGKQDCQAHTQKLV